MAPAATAPSARAAAVAVAIALTAGPARHTPGGCHGKRRGAPDRSVLPLLRAFEVDSRGGAKEQWGAAGTWCGDKQVDGHGGGWGGGGG